MSCVASTMCTSWTNVLTSHPMSCVASTMCTSWTNVLTTPPHPMFCVASTMCTSWTSALASHPMFCVASIMCTRHKQENVVGTRRPRGGPTKNMPAISGDGGKMSNMFLCVSCFPRVFWAFTSGFVPAKEKRHPAQRKLKGALWVLGFWHCKNANLMVVDSF